MKYWNKRTIGLLLIIILICLYGLIKEETDYMYYLKEERWTHLSMDERLDVLRYIKEEQLDQLEVDYMISLNTTKLEGRTVGCYNNTNKLILIDEHYLMNKTAQEVVSVICHEAYHAYQYHLVEYYDSLDDRKRAIPAYNIIETYKKELENYVRDGEDYYQQKVEEDARNYASQTIKQYQF